MYTIRDMTPTDIVAGIDIARALWDEGSYGAKGFDKGHTIRSLMGVMYNPDGIGIVAVDRETNKIVGGMLGVVETYFCVPGRQAIEHGIYLKPELRGRGRLAFRLAKAFMARAKEKGADEMLALATNGIDDKRVERFYTALGFKPVGPALRGVL